MIRVLVVDDSAMVRDGLREFLETQTEDITVVGECSGEECNEDGIIEVAARTDPDIVLMCLKVSDRGRGPIGLQTTRALLAAQPHRRVIVHASGNRPDMAKEARDAGAVGYLIKGDQANQLISQIRAAAEKGTAWTVPPSGR